jgi:hypothetical protein
MGAVPYLLSGNRQGRRNGRNGARCRLAGPDAIADLWTNAETAKKQSP